MQSLVLEKTIVFPKKVDELIQVTIDDSIEYVNKSDGITLKGKIYLAGEVKLDGEIREFLDTLDVDIYASLDQLIDKKQVQLRVDDFDYKIKDNKINFYIKTIIDGVNDVKSTFPVEEPDSMEEKTLGTVETLANPLMSEDLINRDSVESQLNNDNFDVVTNQETINEDKACEFDVAANEETMSQDRPCEFAYKDLDTEEVSPNKAEQSKKIGAILNFESMDDEQKEQLMNLLQDAIIIDKDTNYEIVEQQVDEKIGKMDETCHKDVHPIKIINETPLKIESDNDTFNYFNLFRNHSKESSVFWRYRVILKDDTYESLASELKLSPYKLRSINNDKDLEIGMLIKIPK